MEDLSSDEREQILYNHVRLGGQPASFRKAIKSLLPAAAAHKRFSPESARRLGEPLFTAGLTISSHGIDNFFERPMELLTEIIQTLDANSKSAIAMVFVRGGRLPSPVDVTNIEKAAINLLGGVESGVREALVALGG